MTKTECLKKMVKVWQYVYDNPANGKYDAYVQFNLPLDKNSCPCCQYVADLTEGIKKHTFQECMLFCPLINFWPEGCEAKNNSYALWKASSSLEVSKMAAGEILNAAKTELRRLSLENTWQTHMNI